LFTKTADRVARKPIVGTTRSYQRCLVRITEKKQWELCEKKPIRLRAKQLHERTKAVWQMEEIKKKKNQRSTKFEGVKKERYQVLICTKIRKGCRGNDNAQDLEEGAA